LKRPLKNKRTRAKSIGRHEQSKSARGRRSKAQEQEVLHTHGAKLAEVFKSDSLRQPIDPEFAPSYEQVLQGKAQAILRYCDEHWEQGNLCGSFYEMLGRLFTLKLYKIADTILRNIERRRVSGWPGERKTYGYWYAKLEVLCRRTRESIRAALKASPNSTREQLWCAYVSQPAWKIRSKQDRKHHKLRQQAIRKELLQGRKSATKRATKQPSESGRLITLVNAFGSFNLVPKEVFFDLALTKRDAGRRKFRLTPSDVARRYACQVTSLSESTVSHWKNAGK
jgi:hypothetical protein